MSRNKYPEETVDRILDVAARLFAEKGYDHTTVQDIIDGLGGLTKGAIYHHFKSKEEILRAVINRLFQNNSLSQKWRQTENDSSLTGTEKLKKMLKDTLEDGQEQQFRELGVNLQNSPQLLTELLIRSVTEIAPNDIQPVLEEIAEDGELRCAYLPELAELIMLTANIWLNPSVFKTDDEKLIRKFNLLCTLFAPLGLQLTELRTMLTEINTKKAAKTPVSTEHEP